MVPSYSSSPGHGGGWQLLRTGPSGSHLLIPTSQAKRAAPPTPPTCGTEPDTTSGPFTFITPTSLVQCPFNTTCLKYTHQERLPIKDLMWQEKVFMHAMLNTWHQKCNANRMMSIIAQLINPRWKEQQTVANCIVSCWPTTLKRVKSHEWNYWKRQLLCYSWLCVGHLDIHQVNIIERILR